MTPRAKVNPAGSIAPLARLARRGGDVDRHHLRAAEQFRVAWERAKAGSAPDRGEVARVLQALGRVSWPLLHWVVIEGQDVAAWVKAQCAAGEQSVDPKKELGRLAYVLDRLVELLDVAPAQAVTPRPRSRSRPASSRPSAPAA